MAKNLDELKDELYTMFNQARQSANDGAKWTYSYPEQMKAAAASIQAAAKTAESIVLVEHEIAEREGSKGLGKLPAPGKAA